MTQTTTLASNRQPNLLIPCDAAFFPFTEYCIQREIGDMRSLTARIVLFTLAAVMAVHASEPVVFPTVSFYTLSKERVTLPADLHGDRTLLLLYFDLTQQRDIDDWNAVIDRWRASDPSLSSYTLLVSPQKNILSRWWQNASIRNASPDANHWPTTLPIYVDKRAFERQLSISSEKQVVLLLTDRKGRVLSRVIGSSTDKSRSAMKTALTAAGSPPAPGPAPASPASSH
jgi:hypothetical protein